MILFEERISHFINVRILRPREIVTIQIPLVSSRAEVAFKLFALSVLFSYDSGWGCGGTCQLSFKANMVPALVR